MSKFHVGDKVMMDGVVTTLLSWPEDDNGPFSWSQLAPGLDVRGTDHYGEVDGVVQEWSKKLTFIESGDVPDTLKVDEPIEVNIADVPVEPVVVEEPADEPVDATVSVDTVAATSDSSGE